MIVNKRTGFAVDKTNIENKTIRSDLHKIDSSEWTFVIPDDITDNNLKVVYKVGFLTRLYSLIYPDYTKQNIWSIINTEWQVFVGVRQMERHWKKYIELF